MKIFQKIQQKWNRQESVRAGMTDGQMDRGTNGLLIVECHAGSEGSGESAHLHGLARALSQYRNLMCWLKWRFNAILCEQRRLCRVCTFAQAYLKPHSHCAGVATVHPDAGQPVYRDAPGHIS